ncbi:UNVERIFIED_CONTAM: hypothetical protein PYX00_007473 [Menopon gallinae]|uniref:Uncharacterized protein n=1 Tax=Menopon gallinae TaxID=328185 RepID=A0AAW2HJG5_9NEOP
MMNLFNMCIHVLAKPDAIQMHLNELAVIPLNIKTSVFKILSKRGYINNLQLLKNLVNPQIKDIDLSECEVCDDFLYCLFECRYLQILDLSLRRKQKRHISAKVLTSLFTHLPYLRVIAIPHCKEVTDDVIESICKTCTLLVELHIPNSSITDFSMQLMGLCLKYLCVINILGTQITDLGVEHFVKGDLRKCLTEVNIDKCPNVTLHSSQVIEQNCPNIRIFTCGGFHEFEDSGLTMNKIRSKAKQVFWSI